MFVVVLCMVCLTDLLNISCLMYTSFYVSSVNIFNFSWLVMLRRMITVGPCLEQLLTSSRSTWRSM